MCRAEPGLPREAARFGGGGRGGGGGRWPRPPHGGAPGGSFCCGGAGGGRFRPVSFRAESPMRFPFRSARPMRRAARLVILFLALASRLAGAQSNAALMAGDHYTRIHDYDLVHQRIVVSEFNWD